jgi:PKD repeat protein
MTWRVAGCLALVLIAVAAQAGALQAVAEVNEDPYYTKYKSKFYAGASLTRYYAPLPVFFEGWKSEPRAEIVDYAWDFGDGSPIYHGFNAAHVYEKVGTYSAKLTVTDVRGAKATSPSIKIEVLEPNGKTYYVDSAIGNDANDGLSTSKPWKTATHAFKGMTNNRYKPGDRILFKRGQTFEAQCGVVAIGHYSTGYGYYFGAYGSGAKPIIRKVGSSTAPLIKQQGIGSGHIAFQDLEFRMTSPEGVEGAEVYACVAEAFNILFLRVDMKDMSRGIGFNGGYSSYRISGAFVVNCTMFDSSNVQFFGRCSRLALIGNRFDLASNHLAYLTWVDKGVIAGNAFLRPPFGRTALRLSAQTSLDYPSNNVCITDNRFQGWIDPFRDNGTHTGGGTRYTWQLVDIGPNTTTSQKIEHIAFQRNAVVDAETLLVVGDAENVLIEANLFYTDDPYKEAYRIELGSRFEAKPLRNVRFLYNMISSNEARGYYAGPISIKAYTKSPYNGQSKHAGIIIFGNIFDLRDSNGAAVIHVADPSTAQLAQVYSDYNQFYTPALAPGGSNLFMIGGTCTNGTLISLDDWRSRTGNDFNSAIAGTSLGLRHPYKK